MFLDMDVQPAERQSIFQIGLERVGFRFEQTSLFVCTLRDEDHANVADSHSASMIAPSSNARIIEGIASNTFHRGLAYSRTLPGKKGERHRRLRYLTIVTALALPAGAQDTI